MTLELGDREFAAGRYEKAIACYDEAIRAYPGHAEAFLHKGAALVELGRREEGAV